MSDTKDDDATAKEPADAKVDDAKEPATAKDDDATEPATTKVDDATEPAKHDDAKEPANAKVEAKEPAKHDAHDAHAHPSYVKIWAILLGLLVVSVTGPMLGIRVVTLITAFGIAIVKASIVARYFMHVTLERRWVGYMLAAMITLVILFFGGVSPDVMKHEGHRWENTAARHVVEKGLEEGAHDEHGASHE